MHRSKKIRVIKKFIIITGRIFKYALWSVILLFIILLLPPVQSVIGSFVTNYVNKSYGVDIQVKKIALGITGNISLKDILIKDHHKDTLISAKNIKTSILNFKKLVEGDLFFGKISAENLHLDLRTYPEDSLSNLDIFVNSFDDGSPSSDVFVMEASEIELKNSQFRIFDYNEKQEEQEQIIVNQINTIIKDFTIIDSDIHLNIISGQLLVDKKLKIENIRSNFSYTEKAIDLKNTTIETPFSYLNGDIAFLSKHGSFGDFLNKVRIKSVFKNSKINTNDLNLFYNEFASDRNIAFKGNIDGFFNYLKISNSQISAENTKIAGAFEFENLFKESAPLKIYSKFEHLSSVYSDLIGFMPNVLGNNLPQSVQKFGFFEGNGVLKYTEEELSADMNFSSQAGDFSIEGIIENLTNTQQASYKGSLITHGLNIGQIIEQKKLGRIGANIQFVGKGLSTDHIDNLFIDAYVNDLEFASYTYKKIELRSHLEKNNLKGSLSVNDPNLKMNVEGLANIANKGNTYDIVTDVNYANLYAMGLVTKDTIADFKGNINIDIQGNTIDDLTGKVAFSNTIYQKNQTTYNFEDFTISIDIDPKKERSILINSPDIVTGKIVGIFKFGEVGKIIQNSIGSIYANYHPFKVSKGQYMHFDLKIYNKIIEIFLPEIALGKNTSIKGTIIADEGNFKLNFKAPDINLYGFHFKKMNLLVDNKNPLYNTYLEVGNIDNSVYNLSDFSLINTTIKDTLFFRTEFRGEKNDSYTLNFYHTINEKQASVIGLKKSQVFFKEKEWIINSENHDNKVVFDKRLDSINIQNFKIQHQDQLIALNGKMAKNSYKDIHLVFDKVQLNDITPDMEGMSVAGLLNGRLSVVQHKNKYFPSSDLVVENFTLNRYEMGDLEIGIDGNETLTSFHVNTQFINQKLEGFRTIGTISIRDGKTFLDLDTNLQKFNLEPFNPLVDGILSNLRGNITGSAHISGVITSPNVNGLFEIENGGMGIPYLKIDTDFAPKSSISLKNNEFIFNNITLTDTQYQTQASLNGRIYHKKFLDWFLDLHLATKNERFLVLNTTETDNDLFYGTGFIKGKANISGNFNNLVLKVNAVTAEGTSFKIPLNEIKTVGDDSFINFKSKNSVDYLLTTNEKSYQGLEMDFDVDILPNAEVEIIIDPKNNSNLIGRGAGTLLFEINTNGKFNMWGDFITTSGEYNFKYEGLIDKKFKVLPGGAITWNGNPLSADLRNLKAVYSLYANPSVLLESTQHNRKINTQVEISLEGNLSHPQTIFDITFPDSNSALVAELNYRLKDTDKKQLQAFSLLLQGNFLTDSSAGEKVVSHNMLETAAGIFNQLLSDKDDKLSLGLSYESGVNDPTYNTGDRLGITFSTQLSSRAFFNGKIGIPVGGTTQTAIAGDFEFQYLLTEDGNLSVKIFNRENEIQQYLLEKIGYTQGIGISYKVDFDTFRDLIKNILKKTNKK